MKMVYSLKFFRLWLKNFATKVLSNAKQFSYGRNTSVQVVSKSAQMIGQLYADINNHYYNYSLLLLL